MITTINEFKKQLDPNFIVLSSNEFQNYINWGTDEVDLRYVYKSDGGKKVFEYYMYDDFLTNKNVYFLGYFIDNKIVALAHIVEKNKNNFYLNYLCVDPIYKGKGYASLLSENIFRWFKLKNYSFETSKYTEIGFKKLKPLFNKLAKKYDVIFKDNIKL